MIDHPVRGALCKEQKFVMLFIGVKKQATHSHTEHVHLSLPFWSFVKQCTGWMYIYRRTLNQSFVSFLRILFSSMTEKATTYCSPNLIVILSTGNNVLFILIHNTQ